MTMTLGTYTLPDPAGYERREVLDGTRRRALSGAFHFRAYSTAKKRAVFTITFDALDGTDYGTVINAWTSCISTAVTFQDYEGNSFTVVAGDGLHVENIYASRYRVSMTLEQVP